MRTHTHTLYIYVCAYLYSFEYNIDYAHIMSINIVIVIKQGKRFAMVCLLCLAPQTGTDKAFDSKTTTRFVRYNLQQLMNDHQTAATKIAKMETRLEAALASGFNYPLVI